MSLQDADIFKERKKAFEVQQLLVDYGVLRLSFFLITPFPLGVDVISNLLESYAWGDVLVGRTARMSRTVSGS